MSFSYSGDRIDRLRAGLSEERLARYLRSHGGDLAAAIRLYERNTRLSEAFYTPLQGLEIVLRNKLCDRMCEAFGSDWLTGDLPVLRADARQSIADVLARSNQNEMTRGSIVAELSFGFWVGLLGPRYDATLYRQSLFRAFARNGRNMKRDVVHGRLNMIRRFRNRVAHHEPIIERDLDALHHEIIEAIGWLCEVTAAWTSSNSRLPSLLAK